jgi:hypothetical protein
MKFSLSAFYSLSTLVLAMLLTLSACQKETTEPEPTPTETVETYTGHMVTTYATATQGTSQTMAVGVKISATAKADEVTWTIIAPLGDYNDPATANVTTSGTTRKLTIPKQKQSYGPGQEVTFEGSGTIEGKKLILSIVEIEAGMEYQHQIEATKQ